METLSLFKRQNYIDVDNPEHARKLGYEYFQIKYDGIWGRMVVENKVAKIYSRTGNLKATKECEIPDCVLIGEFMFGTNWAIRTGREGKFYVFDVESIGFANYTKSSYEFRFTELVKFTAVCPEWIKLCGLSRIEDAQNVWDKIESGEEDYEGLVFRKFSDTAFSTLARCKREITDDVVVIDKYEGQGRLTGTLGGLVVGKHKNGDLTAVYKVGGGFDDELRHEIWTHWQDWQFSVIECKGKARFESGALRHPVFSRRRPDKLMYECVFSNDES